MQVKKNTHFCVKIDTQYLSPQIITDSLQRSFFSTGKQVKHMYEIKTMTPTSTT